MSTRRRVPKKQPTSGVPNTHLDQMEPSDGAGKERGTLDELIERERIRLMQADSIIGCASIALEYEETDRSDAPHVPDVLEIARELICTTINSLDSVNRKKPR